MVHKWHPPFPSVASPSTSLRPASWNRVGSGVAAAAFTRNRDPRAIPRAQNRRLPRVSSRAGLCGTTAPPDSQSSPPPRQAPASNLLAICAPTKLYY
eukprot:scaffold6959_cov146-Isochrysis_galbana.AAC.5